MVFNNPRGELAVRVSIAFTVIADFVVVVRLWTRLVIIRTPGLEDLCIFVAMLLCTAFTVLTKVQVDRGFGLHVWQLKGDDITSLLKV